MLLFFKYGEPKHIEAFFRDGSIQIGTVRAYDEATFGTSIGDDQEGFSYQAVHDGNVREWLEAGKPLPTFGGLPAFLHPGCGGNLFITNNIGFNYAIFPMSYVLHRDLCLDFSKSYGAAIVINRPFVFLHELSKAFQESQIVECAEFQHVADISYRSRELEAHEDGEAIIEVFIKEPRYAHQGEVRAIWNVGEPKEKFYRFKAPNARKACRLIMLDDMPTYDQSVELQDRQVQFRNALEKSTFPTG